MSDSLPSGISVDVEFAAGEIVSPQKLNAITSQVRRGLSQVERALGDLHGESYPYSSSSDTTLVQRWGKDPTDGTNLDGAAVRRLDIPSLARLIGPASNLNPKMLPGITSITEATPVGVHEFSLKYPVSGAVASVTTDDPAMSAHKGSPTSLKDPGDWHVSGLGKVRSVSPTEGGEITYDVNPAEWNSGMNYQQATFNVIPDPNQTSNGVGLTIGSLDGSGRRTITLPVITHQQSNVDGLAVDLDDSDVNFERQLKLPRVLTTTGFSAGDEIPAGFLYLRNDTTGELYEDAVYYYNDEDTLLIGNANLTSALGAGNVFSLITVGTDITTTLDDLRNKSFHSHDRSNGEPFVNVGNLIGQLSEAGTSGVWVASDIPSNYFPQYLHRDGWRDGFDENANDSNGMRGDIVFGIDGSTAGTYLDNIGIGESYGVKFGGVSDNAPKIHKRADGFLSVHGGNTSVLVDLEQLVGPNTDTSTALVVRNGPVKAEQGFRFPGATKQGTNVGIFAVQGLVPAPGTVYTQFVPTGGELDDIEDKFWLDVRLNLVDPASATDATYGPSKTADPLFLWDYYFDTSGGVSRIFFFANDVTWPPPDNIQFSLVIHYIP